MSSPPAACTQAQLLRHTHTHTHITVAESGTFTEKSLICTGAWPPTLHSPNHPLTAMHSSSDLLQHILSPLQNSENNKNSQPHNFAVK